MKFIHFLFIFLFGFTALAQDQDSNYKTKTVAVQNSILVDSVSINSAYFGLKRKDNTIIDTTFYSVDFAKALITLKKPIESDSIIIDYLSYPEFLTKTYKQLDDRIIVENTDNLQQLYKIRQASETNTFIPFDGLNTSGSISRGVIIGNNQNSVLNSDLTYKLRES